MNSQPSPIGIADLGTLEFKVPVLESALCGIVISQPPADKMTRTSAARLQECSTPVWYIFAP